jgi:branched-chain amino acid aminotransferase
MEITRRSDRTDLTKARDTLSKELGFGRYFADLMFQMRYTEGKGWHDPEIGPYQPFALDPASMVFHYGQEIFEGQKAYRWEDGRVAMFRPDANAARMNRSAQRLCMPAIPVDDQMQAVFTLVGLLQEWIPPAPSSLYVRPFMISTEPALGVRAANQYLYSVICSPVGPYFAKGFAPVRVKAEPAYVRAVEGGTGDAKCGGNYANSLLAQNIARKEGYEAVLWLDAKEHRYVEEIGAMNILFVIDGKLVTSPLHGSILPGITRDSILRLARDLGIVVEERSVSIREIIEGIQHGVVKEAFGAGTAAVITPVGTIGWGGKDFHVNGGEVGPITRQFYKTLTDYQYGKAQDPYGWVRIVETAKSPAGGTVVGR